MAANCRRLSFYWVVLFSIICTLCLLWMSLQQQRQHKAIHESSDNFTTGDPSASIVTMTTATTATENLIDRLPRYHYHDKHSHTSSAMDLFELNRAPVINHSRHYTYLVIIASNARHFSRRRLIRQTYFGLRDNLIPCMTYDTDTFYRFWIYGGIPSTTSMRRQYETEKMEWNDMVESPVNLDFEQDIILKWVEKDLRQQHNITYDYLIVQDIHTFVQLETVKRELDAQVIGSNTESPIVLYTEAPLNMIWAPMVGNRQDRLGFIIGHDAAVIALDAQQSDLNPPSRYLITDLKKYFDISGEAIVTALDATLEPEESAAEQERIVPLFIQDGGQYGVKRFMEWQNNVESVPVMENVVVTNVYQDQDFEALVIWTQLHATPVCYATINGHQRAYNFNTDEEYQTDDAKLIEELLYEQQHPTIDQQENVVETFAIATSSFLTDNEYGCADEFATATRAALNKRQYALTNGYAFIARSAEFDHHIPTQLDQRVYHQEGILSIVEKLLPKYSWVFWMDRDIIIMNNSQSIQGILTHASKIYNSSNQHQGKLFNKTIHLIVISAPASPSLYLFRKSSWTTRFLRELQLLCGKSKMNADLEHDDNFSRSLCNIGDTVEDRIRQLVRHEPQHSSYILSLGSQQDDASPLSLYSSSSIFLPGEDSFLVYYNETQCLLSSGLDLVETRHG